MYKYGHICQYVQICTICIYMSYSIIIYIYIDIHHMYETANIIILRILVVHGMEQEQLVLMLCDQFCMPISGNLSSYFENNNMQYNNHC